MILLEISSISSKTSMDKQFLKHNIKGVEGVVILIIWIISSTCILRIKRNTITVSAFRIAVNAFGLCINFLGICEAYNIFKYNSILSYMDISVGFFVNYQILNQKNLQGFFYEWSMILFLPLFLKEKKNITFFFKPEQHMLRTVNCFIIV